MSKALDKIKKELDAIEKEAAERLSKMTPKEKKELESRANRFAKKVESAHKGTTRPE